MHATECYLRHKLVERLYIQAQDAFAVSLLLPQCGQVKDVPVYVPDMVEDDKGELHVSEGSMVLVLRCPPKPTQPEVFDSCKAERQSTRKLVFDIEGDVLVG